MFFSSSSVLALLRRSGEEHQPGQSLEPEALRRRLSQVRELFKRGGGAAGRKAAGGRRSQGQKKKRYDHIALRCCEIELAIGYAGLSVSRGDIFWRGGVIPLEAARMTNYVTFH